MAIQYAFSRSDDPEILLVTTHGHDESLGEVEAYGMAVIQACITESVSRVLCDERKLEYRLGTLDTYLAAQFIAEHAPHVGKVAIVCDPNQFQDARFWENVAVNRGVCVRAFTAMPVARAWLDDPD